MSRKAICLKQTRAGLRVVPAQSFSDLVKSVEQTRLKLSDIIQNELDEEEENVERDNETDREIQKFSDQHGWKFIIDPNTVRIEAVKEIGDTKVQVLTRLRNEMANEDGEQGEENQETDAEDEMEGEMNDTGADSFTEIKVVITRAGKSKSLVAEMFIFGEERNIGSMYLTDDKAMILSFNDMMQQQKDFYSGPQFESLDDKMQNGFHRYLNDLGVDSDFLVFLESLTVDLENRYYAQWLGEINDYLA